MNIKRKWSDFEMELIEALGGIKKEIDSDMPNFIKFILKEEEYSRKYPGKENLVLFSRLLQRCDRYISNILPEERDNVLEILHNYGFKGEPAPIISALILNYALNNSIENGLNENYRALLEESIERFDESLINRW